MAAVKNKSVEIEIEPMKTGKVSVWLKGLTPIINNRMAAKVNRELLLPKGKRGKAEREQSLKHDPIAEYRNSMSVRPGTGPTRVVFPAPAVKGAMMEAAKETAGTSAAQIGRLVWVHGYSCDLYGVPELFMAVVRSADMNKTPDVRTRSIFREWCLKVTIEYVTPQMNSNTLMQLLANAGIIIGIGDFRQQKGKGNYGQFEIASEEQCKEIVKRGGMKQQDAAILSPDCYDADTQELLSWFNTEIERRGKTGQLTSAPKQAV